MKQFDDPRATAAQQLAALCRANPFTLLTEMHGNPDPLRFTDLNCAFSEPEAVPAPGKCAAKPGSGPVDTQE